MALLGPTIWTWSTVLGMLLPGTPALAQAAKAPEYSLKAAYLFNFAQFIEWPSNRFASAEAPIVIGVLGDDPFGAALDQAVKGKTLGARPFEIRRFKQITEVRGCHVLFVCSSEAKRVAEIVAASDKAGVLTVSDLDRFAEQGGTINFYTENNKVRFKINLSAAERGDQNQFAALAAGDYYPEVGRRGEPVACSNSGTCRFDTS